MNPVQLGGSQPVLDCTDRDTSVEELGAADDAVLARCDPRDLGVRRGGCADFPLYDTAFSAHPPENRSRLRCDHSLQSALPAGPR
jgi:hypothetical protein